MKKLLTVMLAAVMLLPCAAGCAEKGSAPETTAASTQATTAEITDAGTADETVPTAPERVDLEGKTILWLGSSVTYGSANNGKSMADYLAEETGCVSVKEAVSGTTLVDNGSGSYIARMEKIRRSVKADYFICQLSTNDATQNKPLGKVSDSFEMDDFDTSTICGAIEYVIAYAKDRWGCTVAFYTNPPYNSAAYGKMVEALMEIQKKWNIPVLDLWNDPELNAMKPAELSKFLARYMADSIHPNEKGYREWWVPMFKDFIETTFG